MVARVLILVRGGVWPLPPARVDRHSCNVVIDLTTRALALGREWLLVTLLRESYLSAWQLSYLSLYRSPELSHLLRCVSPNSIEGSSHTSLSIYVLISLELIVLSLVRTHQSTAIIATH